MVETRSKALMSGLGILSEAELVSRCHVRTERYVKNLLIEGDTLRQMVDTQVLPAGYAYHGRLASEVVAARAAGVDAPQAASLKRMTEVLNRLGAEREVFEKAFHAAETESSEEAKAQVLAQKVSVAMAQLRGACDELEAQIADEFWPLPKYRELLFIS
jgi:glutamine synthetase